MTAHSSDCATRSRNADIPAWNRVPAEIAGDFGVSQPTLSRAISAITPLLARVLADLAITADDLDPAGIYIVDGTPLSCWTWRVHTELMSGMHRASEFKLILA